MVRMDGRGRLCGPKITRFNSNFKLPRSREEKQELTVIIVSTEQLTLPTAYLQWPTSGPTEINKDTMVIIILKTSCTPASPPQPPISDNTLSSSSSLFDYHSNHNRHSNIQCDVSFLSTNNDNNFIMLRQSFRPCGIDNVLLLTRHHNNNDDASRRYNDDDDGFSISLTNCQFNQEFNSYHDVDVSPSTVRLTYNNNNADLEIGQT